MTETTTQTEAAPTISDEEALQQFIDLLETRVEITTGFISDDVTGNLTHQVLQISCGEFVSYSQPEPLAIPLRPATKEELGEQGITIN